MKNEERRTKWYHNTRDVTAIVKVMKIKLRKKVSVSRDNPFIHFMTFTTHRFSSAMKTPSYPFIISFRIFPRREVNRAEGRQKVEQKQAKSHEGAAQLKGGKIVVCFACLVSGLGFLLHTATHALKFWVLVNRTTAPIPASFCWNTFLRYHGNFFMSSARIERSSRSTILPEFYKGWDVFLWLLTLFVLFVGRGVSISYDDICHCFILIFPGPSQHAFIVLLLASLPPFSHSLLNSG